MTQEQEANAAVPAFSIVLASGSPRRRQLLADAGVEFTVLETDADESLDADLLAMPLEAVKKLAERKAGAAVQQILAGSCTSSVLVIGADTMVVHNGEIFGKPRSLDDGKRMLRALSGDAHDVHTAVSLWFIAADGTGEVSLAYRTFVDTAHVVFKELSDERIADYLKLGESFDKAGAYAIHGRAPDVVDHVVGLSVTVIGLPVQRLLRELPEIAPRAATGK